ncbi:Collagen alpha-3(VI) chain like protein [Argiope bruennichi]|uniref:Collagen alpha-3(VI) chain like protein n=1 Tax=Argiope bruennichi TaxID=94029 RepID=A0A8T0E613_ARGBR|nr:Collagen alpha-3(VI) chain like protein [Argiope bruennichi]
MHRIIPYVVICLLMHLLGYVVCDPYQFKNRTKRSDILRDEVAEMEAEQKFGEYNEVIMKISHNRSKVNSGRSRSRRGLNTNLPGRLFFYFVFDVSESIKETNFKKSVEFAKAIVRKVGISKNGIRIGALTFSSAAETQFLPFKYETTEDALAALDQLNFAEGGSVSRSILTLIREKDIPLTQRIFRPKEMRSVIFIFTDGKSNMGGNPSEEAGKLKQTGVEIYCIGITDSVQQASLNAIASEPKEEHVFNLQNYASISHLVAEVIDGTTDSHHLDNGTKINNTLQESNIEKDPQREGNMEKHYELHKTKINGDKTRFYERLVFYFVFDVSEIIGEMYFRKSVEFAKAFVIKVGVSKNGTRVGALTFSSTAETQFLPFVYETTDDVLVALDELNFEGGGSASRSVLTLIREKDIPLTQRIFSTKEMRSIILIFTDGKSNMGDNLREEAELLKQAGVEKIYCIGITNSVQETFLNAIASEPKEEHVFILQNYANMSYLVEEIADGTLDSYDPDNSTNISNTLQEADIEKEPDKEQNLTETRQEGTEDISFNNFSGRLVFYFIFDVSGSIKEVNFRKSVQFAKAFVRKVGISKYGARAGAVLLSSRAETQFLPLNFETTEDVLAALDILNFTGGGSAPNSALVLIREELIPLTVTYLPKKGMKSIIFIFTDGKANRGGDPSGEAELLKQAGVEIFCIGVTMSVLRGSLNKMASEPKVKHVFLMENYANMSYMIEEITDIIENSYYIENNTKIGGQEENLEEIQIPVSEAKRNGTKDISFRNLPGRPVFYFLFDVSESVKEVNFRKSVEFAKAFVKKVGISKNGSRVGALTFSSAAEAQFLPFVYETTEDVLADLDELSFTGGEFAPNSALALIREEHIPLTEYHLSKKGMKSIIFIFTDGKSNRGGDPNDEAKLLKQKGVEIFCIGSTKSIQIASLNKIASEPKEEHVFIFEDYATESYLVEEIIDVLVNYTTCGVYPRKSGNNVGRGKIVGGRKIIDPWPWMAALYTVRQDLHPEFLCGGSVIHEKFILTAAHCLYANHHRRVKEREILVKLGQIDVRNQSSLQESGFNSLVRPICLPPRELLHDTSFYKPGEHVVAIGWGLTRIMRIMEQVEYQPPDILKEIILPIQSRERCRSREAFFYLLRESAFSDRMFCAGDGKGGNDTCPGDSGGPVMQSWLNEDGDTYWTQVGIVSWGLGCGLAKTYGYYTHVHKLVDWVISNISLKN